MFSATTLRRSTWVLVLALAGSLGLAGFADARPGSGQSVGSRGGYTYSPPPTTNTAPRTAAPIERSITQPSRPSPTVAAPAQTSRFGGWGGLLMGGLIGAGLASLFGVGAMAHALGFVLQVALIGGLIWLAWSFFGRRTSPAGVGNAYARTTSNGNVGSAGGYGMGGPSAGAASRAAAPQSLNVGPDDFNAFERLLGEIQLAYGRNDLDTLGRISTPEMLSYFAEDLTGNAKRGVRNEVGSPKLLQGDLAQAWSEASGEYATVAMRFSITDATVDARTGRVIEVSRERPIEVTEVWTFVRPRGASSNAWQLSAIQQTR